MKPLRRLLAGFALTAAVLTGLFAAIDDIVSPTDTAWGASDTTTTPVTDIVDDVSVTPFDTAWG